jgi:hypothetical protein
VGASAEGGGVCAEQKIVETYRTNRGVRWRFKIILQATCIDAKDYTDKGAGRVRKFRIKTVQMPRRMLKVNPARLTSVGYLV